MGIFDHIDAYMRTDEEGNRIFFPHGVFARGKTIPSEQAESELRQFLRKQEVVGLIVGVPFALVMAYLYCKYGATSLLVFAIPLFLYLAYYHRRINRILKGSQTSDVRLTYDELAITTYSTWFLWLLVIFFGSVLVLLVGLVYCEPVWQGIVLILSSGAIWLAFLILLIKKRKSKRADSLATVSV